MLLLLLLLLLLCVGAYCDDVWARLQPEELVGEVEGQKKKKRKKSQLCVVLYVRRFFVFVRQHDDIRMIYPKLY